MGLAYAGSNRADLILLLSPVLTDAKSNMEVRTIAAKYKAINGWLGQYWRCALKKAIGRLFLLSVTVFSVEVHLPATNTERDLLASFLFGEISC